MHHRSTFVAAAATLSLLAMAGRASAHEEISPKTFPTGQATFLTLTVANEASVDLVRVALRAPAGVAFGEATRSPSGWSAAGTDDTVTWTGGAVKPHTFESWGFEIGGADQPATLTYKVTLGYAGGKTDEHEVEVIAAAPGIGGTAAPVTTSTTAATETTATPPTTAAAPAGSEGRSDNDSGTATAALVISIVALVLAVGALVAGARRRGEGPAPNGTTGGETAAGAAQDW